MNNFEDSLYIVDAKNLCTCIYDGIERLDANRDTIDDRIKVKERIIVRLQELKNIIEQHI